MSNAAPLPAAVALACALHHVTHDVVALVPLVADAVHHSVVGGAYLLVGCIARDRKIKE